MAVRLFFFLLVLANLVFFAWSQGHFGARNDNREPQRLTQQLQADKLRIVRNSPSAETREAALACRAINGLNRAEAESLKSAMKTAGVDASVLPPPEPNPHLVVITDLANKVAAEKKAAELVRFGVTEQTAIELADARYEIVLGQFPSEAAARQFLQGLLQRGIRSARLDNRASAANIRVEARGSGAELLRQLPQLLAPYANATVGECSS